MFVGVYFADLLGRGKQVQLGVIMPQSVIFCTFLTCLIYFKSKLFFFSCFDFWLGGRRLQQVEFCSLCAFIVFWISKTLEEKTHPSHKNLSVEGLILLFVPENFRSMIPQTILY